MYKINENIYYTLPCLNPNTNSLKGKNYTYFKKRLKVQIVVSHHVDPMWKLNPGSLKENLNSELNLGVLLTSEPSLQLP